MLEGNSDYTIDGILDVSVVVPACFENPLKVDCATLVHDALTQKRRSLLPISSVIGAYHIATRYLRVPRTAVKRVLDDLLRTGSSSLYPYITAKTALTSLDYASIHGIESWDGYMVAIATELNAKFIFSLDEELKKKIKGVVTVVNPFDLDKVMEYHNFLNEKIGKE